MRVWKSLICAKILNIATSSVRFAQNVNGTKRLPVLKTKWPPYDIFNVKWGHNKKPEYLPYHWS